MKKNYGEILGEFALKKYGSRLQKIHDKLYNEYPYKSKDMPDELYLKNFLELFWTNF